MLNQNRHYAEHHPSDSAAVQCLLPVEAGRRADISSCGPLAAGPDVEYESWVWPEVGREPVWPSGKALGQ